MKKSKDQVFAKTRRSTMAAPTRLYWSIEDNDEPVVTAFRSGRRPRCAAYAFVARGTPHTSRAGARAARQLSASGCHSRRPPALDSHARRTRGARRPRRALSRVPSPAPLLDGFVGRPCGFRSGLERGRAASHGREAQGDLGKETSPRAGTGALARRDADRPRAAGAGPGDLVAASGAGQAGEAQHSVA